MPILAWTPSLSVNVEIIDKQHQKLFELANLFYDELYKGANQNCLVERLKELIDYTCFHFRTEENLLEEINYPNLTNHANEHKQFIEELNALNSSVQSGKLTISVETINFLRNSIINHIFVSDKEMTRYMNT
jgi:hemerythrin-like metal-binding protein